MSEEEFRSAFQGSPLRRAKRAGLRRNAVIAMGNSGDRKFLSVLDKLVVDKDEVVSESAAWAIRKLAATQIKKDTDRSD
jgi:epoxyqueuosine reductase